MRRVHFGRCNLPLCCMQIHMDLAGWQEISISDIACVMTEHSL